MSGMLRIPLVLLVLTNLGFVYITEAASLSWLIPLVGLTVASAALVPLRRHLVYRLAWNGAVIGVFALLVHHATSAGIHFLLEDGLLLAALCQVHLLNNIGPSQKPDLLFFNSFLIAVVTSFLSLDLGYSLVFLIYAPVLVFAMQALCLSRVGGAAVPKKTVLQSGLVRAGVALAVTLTLFLAVPRDFHRKGLLGDRLRLRPPGAMAEIDFSDRVSLTPLGREARSSGRVVMRVRLLEGDALAVPVHWRGATLDRFDGRNWTAVSGAAWTGGDFWEPTRDGGYTRRGGEITARVEAELTTRGPTRLFAPLDSRRLELLTSTARRRTQPLADLTFLLPAPLGEEDTVRYRIGLAAETPVGRQRLCHPVHARLDPRTVSPAALELIKETVDSLPEGLTEREIVQRLARRVSTDHRYVGPGEESGAGSLEEFLSGDAGGHCEYFATALALMLRQAQIPSRLVTGYRSSEWDESGTVLTIRARDAHAWVEALDRRTGWYTVDPTPAGDPAAANASGVFARIGDGIRGFWVRLTGFDSDGRARALASIKALPARSVRAVGDHPFAAAIVAALLATLLVVRHCRRRGSVPATVRQYLKAVRRAGVRPGPAETPRELLKRARRLALRPKRLRRLESVVTRHEEARYR